MPLGAQTYHPNTNLYSPLYPQLPFPFSSSTLYPYPPLFIFSIRTNTTTHLYKLHCNYSVQLFPFTLQFRNPRKHTQKRAQPFPMHAHTVTHTALFPASTNLKQSSQLNPKLNTTFQPWQFKNVASSSIYTHTPAHLATPLHSYTHINFIPNFRSLVIRTTKNRTEPSKFDPHTLLYTYTPT